MKTTLRFDGGQAIAKALESLSTRITTKVKRDALDTAAQPMARRMSQMAPKSEEAPHLKEMIGVGTNARGQDANEVAVAVGPTRSGFYGSFQEFGTAHHGAQPFARPAFDETAPQCLAQVGRAFWTELAARGIRPGSTSSGGAVTGGPGGGLL
jgi:HK97 gp10 family phage protein